MAEAAPALLYLPEIPGAGTRVELAGAEAHYVARVCRARVGEQIEATDGHGLRATLRLTEVRGVVVAEVEAIEREELAQPAWVLCGAPEGERADWLVEKLAELGVARFQPVDTERARWRGAAGRRERWERLAIAALRQSRRVHLMAVEEPVAMEQALGSVPAGWSRWLADVAGRRVVRGGGEGGAVGLVGPASGLTAGEREAAVGAGFVPMRLSSGRLRAETAALAWAFWWTEGAA